MELKKFSLFSSIIVGVILLITVIINFIVIPTPFRMTSNPSSITVYDYSRSSTGKTLRSYVKEQRIKKAIELLLSTEDTLTQIAYSCGFSSQSYFSNAFKKKMNCTPREYVKKMHLRYENTRL